MTRTARIERITDAYVRHYTDSGQITAYVEWVDTDGQTGRTEGGNIGYRFGQHLHYPPSTFILIGSHMEALFARASREGIPIRGETW